MKKTTVLRRLLEKDGILVAPGSYNALSALMVQEAGFEAVYMSGANAAKSLLGVPDVGLITMNEMVMITKLIASRVDIPVIADADTGYGNALNLKRTVGEYLMAGAAGMHVEDQTLPKRCGNLSGKVLVSEEEFVGKIRASKDVISEMDKDFVFIARTDARNSVGGSLEEAIIRGNAYAKAGADLILPDGLLSREEVERFTKEVKAPVMIFQGFGALLGPMTVKELEEAGVKVVALPGETLNITISAMRDSLHELKTKGTTIGLKDRLMPLKEQFDLVGLQKYREDEIKYLPKEEVSTKYKESTGL